MSPRVQRPFFELLDRPDPPPPIVDYLAGVATRELMLRFEVGPDSRLPQEPPAEDAFADVLAGTARAGFAALADDARQQAEVLQRLARLAEQQPPQDDGGDTTAAEPSVLPT